VSSGSQVSVAIDMWAFGIVVHEMITGRKPPVCLNDDTRVSKPSAVEWDSLLIDLVQGCLKRDPCERFTSTEALNHPYFY
jgi:serine/threonine protein kinase